MNKGLEALKRIWEMVGTKEDYAIIEKELILLNALRIKLNRKIETKEYKHEESNSYRIATLLTYELKEQWDDIELQALKQFLLNLSGISKELKALEIIKEKRVDTLLLFRCFQLDDLYGHSHFETYNQELHTQNMTQKEYDLLKEWLK